MKTIEEESTKKSEPIFLTDYESQQLAALREELVRLVAMIERKIATYATGEQMNPAGDIGGIRSRSVRQKKQLMARYSREANEHGELMKQKRDLEKLIRSLENRPERRRRQWYQDVAVLQWWDSLKPGDTFQPGNAPLLIKRKNRMSIVLTTGTRWSITEVTGLSRERIKEIRAHLTQPEK